VLLQRAIEQVADASIDAIARERVFAPLAMHDTRFDEPEPGFHGSRPLLTTAGDYAQFLALVLGIDDERWQPLCRVDDELAWAAGWGLELVDPVCGWQWGLDIIPNEAGNFVIGCRETGDGVVVLTDDAVNGRDFYREVVARELPGDHPSLRVEHNPTWLALNA
jgi:CubicO group peptidase (beta-lactamase class C family)